MNFELVQRDDKNTHVNVENPLNISDLIVRQSPSRTAPLFPASGASKTQPTILPPRPRMELSEPRNNLRPLSEFHRDDRRPSTKPREHLDSYRRSDDRNDRRSDRRNDDRRSDRRNDDRNDRRSDRKYDDRNDRRNDEKRNRTVIDDEPVELDLLANPKKKKREDQLSNKVEEDFSELSPPRRNDNYAREDELKDFQHKRDSRDRYDSRDRDRHDSRDRYDSRSRRHESRSRHDSRDRHDSRYNNSYPNGSSNTYSNTYSNTHSASQPTYEQIQQRKQRVFERFDKLMRRGVQVQKRFLDATAIIEEQEIEADRLEKHIEVEESIQFQQKALMAVTTGLEFLNNRFNPIGLYLNGWSESVMEDIETYDPVFEDLYEKYHTQVAMSPEFKLIFMLASSAFMYHISHTFFKSQMPNTNPGTNPDMMKNMRRSAMGAMNSFAGNNGPRANSNMFSQPPPSQQHMSNQQQPMSNQQPPQSFAMRGPNTNTNDLLNQFMDRNPNNINDSILHEIDNILDNPSDDGDDVRPEQQVRNINLNNGGVVLNH